MKKIKSVKGAIMISFALLLVLLQFIYLYLLLTNSYNEILIYSGFRRRTLFVLLLMYMCIYLLISKLFGGYKIGYYRLSEIIYSQVLSLLISNVLLIMMLLLVYKRFFWLPPLLKITAIQVITIIIWSFLGNKMYFKLNTPDKMLLIYGDSPELLIRKMISRPDRYNICLTIEENKSIEEIKKTAKKYNTIFLYEVDENFKTEIIKFCYEKKKQLYIAPKVSDIIVSHHETVDLFDTPIFVYNNKGLSTEQRVLKRLLDLIIIIPASIILSPFMLITALCIKLYDGGPVFFKQKRLTKNAKEFYVYKFRSMKVDAEKDGKARLATVNDDRITPVGKVIRAIRFDELPQIINILKGDMSIVGPRPERPEIAEEYYKVMPEFEYRLKVKAGLTGYAQILGKYNTSPIDKVKLDLIYIQNYSFLLDLKLILMTIKILFMAESTEGIQEGDTLASDILKKNNES